jgi:hypothetical protein
VVRNRRATSVSIERLRPTRIELYANWRRIITFTLSSVKISMVSITDRACRLTSWLNCTAMFSPKNVKCAIPRLVVVIFSYGPREHCATSYDFCRSSIRPVLDPIAVNERVTSAMLAKVAIKVCLAVANCATRSWTGKIHCRNPH